MSNDYSTPTPTETPDKTEWVRGNLPGPESPPAAALPPVGKEKAGRRKRQEKEKEREKERGAEANSETLPQTVIAVSNGDLSLEALVESLLFVADGPVPVTQVAEALEVTPRAVEAALMALAETYASGQRGLSLQRSRDNVQLTTAPAAGSRVERFLGLAATQPLTRASLETLAIIAYQQPVTRPQIEAVRGVNSDSVLKNLLGKGLIEEVGRTEGPGRPVLYATTPEFLQYFGLTSLADLPALNLEMPQPPAQPQGEDEAQPAAEQPEAHQTG